MNRQQKEAVVASFKELFTNSQASFLVRYKGLDVKGMSDLRTKLRENGGELKVTKARLMKLAAEGIEGIDAFKDEFKEQVALVFAYGEVPTVAKQVVEFSKENKALEVLSGFFESKVLSSEEVMYFATLPSREVLLAQVASLLQAPASNLARALTSPMQQLASGLKQLSERG